MNQQHRIPLAVMAGLWFAAGSSFAEILVDLDPSPTGATPPLYDSAVKGVVNDGGNQPGNPNNQSGIPAITDSGSYTHAKGFTFHVEFTPVNADRSGTRLLMEIGGNNSGAGLYLIDGVPTLLSKHGATNGGVPVLPLPDTSLSVIGVQSSLGRVETGVGYSFSASWNHAGTLELRTKVVGGESVAIDSFGISGTPGNWSGNDTLSVKTLAVNNAGGLSGADAGSDLGAPFDVDYAKSFGGTIQRAIFWNTHAVTALTLTEPEIIGFGVTKSDLPGTVRFHWDVTEGGLPNPTTLEIRDADHPEDPAIHVPATLSGFADVETSAVNFKITAVNATGEVDATRAVEGDNAFADLVREAGPAAWYRFNELAGSRLVIDSAPNLTPHNGVVQGPSVTGASGFIDGAAAFEAGSAVIGSNIFDPGSFVAVPADGTPRKGFTIETVVRRRPGPNGNKVIVSQTDLNGTGRAILGVSENGIIYSNLPGGERKEADVRLPVNVWSHLVLVVDTGTEEEGTSEIRWYLDGVKIGTTTDGLNPGGATFDPNIVPENSEGNWIIGSSKSLSAEFWKGDLDEVVIYPSLLDDPDGDGDTIDSRIGTHRNAWYGLTKGIIQFDAVATSVKTGESTQLRIKVGPDVTEASIDQGVGPVSIVDGEALVTVTPSATTTYTLTATTPDGDVTATASVTYNQLTVPVVYGYEATWLPASEELELPERVRLHWLVTAGDFSTPTTVVLKSGDTVLHTSTSLKGYFDWETTLANAVDLKIEATNLIGTSTWEAEAPAADTPYSATVRERKPLAWFRFNEANGSGLIVDSATNDVPHNGVLNGPAVNVDATGFIDRAGVFGTNSGILTDRIVDFAAINRGFSVEAIVRTEPGTSGTNRVLFAQQDSDAGAGRQILSVDDNGYVRGNLGGGVNKYSDLKVPAQTWTHIVMVADAATNELRWYIDGEFAGTSLDDTPPGEAPNFEFSTGAWVIAANKGLDGSRWKGQIDELVVYDVLLDDLDEDGIRAEDPAENDNVIDTVVGAHRNAWWQETSGLIYSAVSSETLEAGESATLTIKVGADVTSVEIDGVIIPIIDGNAVIPLNPSSTHTYTITLNGPGGPITRSYTITVNGGDAPLVLVSHRLENGNFIIEFQGKASTTYAVKGSTDLESFAVDHGSVTTDANGDGTATIAIDPLKEREFFRIELSN
jgi:hypothetical protein